MNDLQHGFWVGFDHSGWLQPDCWNMPSAEQHLEVTDRYLEAELTSGRNLGPINWLGMVPKGHTSKKWHLIIDLVSGRGQCQRWHRLTFLLHPVYVSG